MPPEKTEMTMTAEELSKLISEQVTKALDEAATAGKFERKEIVNSEEKDLKELKGAEKACKFLQALATNNEAHLKALSEGTDADGGYIVPTEFRAIVLEKLVKAAVIRPNATIIPMSTDKLEMPTEGNAVVAYWTNESVDGQESDPTFGQVVLTPFKLFGYAKTSRELLADASIDVMNYVAAQFAKAFQKAEDTAFMVGTGTDEPKGLRAYTVPSEDQLAAALTAEDIIGIFYKLPVQYRASAKWLMNNDVIKKVRLLKSIADGRFLWTDGLGEAPATLLGRPVLEQNDIPLDLGTGQDESEIWFGDLSFYLVGDRQQMIVETSTEAEDAFKKHQMHIKAILREDGKLGQTEAFVKLAKVK